MSSEPSDPDPDPGPDPDPNPDPGPNPNPNPDPAPAEGVPTANRLSALLHSRPLNSTVSFPTQEPEADL